MKEDIAVKVQKQLFELQDLKYRDFHAKLMPTIQGEGYMCQNSGT